MERIDDVASEIEHLGRGSLRKTCDVTDKMSLACLRDQVVKEFGQIEILVNSAGTIKRSPTLEVSEADWDNILEVNLKGVLLSCHVFGDHMIQCRYGRIINIASLTSFVALVEVATYAASKGGVLSLTRSLAIEWASHGVCVNAIVPGVFRTPLNQELLDGTPRGQELLMRTPMKRFGRVEELNGGGVSSICRCEFHHGSRITS
jgi:NAD(P)-dependent dehydrogenase (short-subunit alcohol dehydrogenase family)